MVVFEVWFGRGGNKAYSWIESGVCEKVKDGSEVLGLSNLTEERENAKMELGARLGETGKQIGGTVETSLVQPHQDEDDYYTAKCTS